MELNLHPRWPPFLIFFFFVVIFTLISLPSSHCQQSPSYLRLVSNATEFPADDYFDYIIVGGGTAGCPLAATLSEKFRVLVLERGGTPFGNNNLMTDEGFLTALTQVDDEDSPAQAFTSEDGVPNARGRVLGGSSAINAGFYSRADQDFYQKSGIAWEHRIVNQSYDWIEKAIVFRPELKRWQTAVRDGMLESGINPYNGFSLDHVIGTKIGGSTFDSSGKRHSAADLLAYANPSNIKVVVHANVERILLQSSFSNTNPTMSAIGALFRDQTGNYHRAMVRNHGEVLLCAGAIGSPQLLLLSGIGPRPYLASWGIPVAHHLPSVGQFLEAASNTVPFITPSRPFFIRPPSNSVYLTVATLMEKIANPLSAGSLRLASTDVRVNPVVRFNYFSNPIDLQRCVNGTRKLVSILNSHAMDGFKFPRWFRSREFRFVGAALPSDVSDDVVMGEFCRRTVTTIWHYHGGCLVGQVVDRNLRVLGVDGLRIVDGSVFRVSPGTNPQATLLMMGR